MKKYSIKFTESAEEDILDLADVINDKYKAPITAKKYTTELIIEIFKLKSTAESIPYCSQISVVAKYGYNARRTNYKKMAIIYTVNENIVVIEAIIPQGNIKDL